MTNKKLYAAASDFSIFELIGKGIDVNEKTGDIARKGSTNKFLGPEPTTGIPV